MKILCVSDIHQQQYPLKNIVDQTCHAVDLILVAGDWTTFGSPEQVQVTLNILLKPGISVWGIAGNCDSAEIEKFLLEQNISLEGNGKMLDNTGFFGLSGSNITPLFTPFEREETDLEILLECGYASVKNAKTKILVSHVPPGGCNVDRIGSGCHAGSTALRKFVETHTLDVVLCGHIHEARGTDRIGNTLIINPGKAGDGYYGILQLGEKISAELKKI